MLNKIVIINSELYSKASIHIGDNSSIQITAENNVGKSSFINALNFLYITDKDQMRFEDDRKLSDSMKHYFDGTSQHSFIIFEIFKNGYYSILVKATPENTIEYYKINGELKEHLYIETSSKGFKAKKWNDILRDLTLDNPTDPPIKLSNEELYSLVYNSDKNKSPVVWIKKDVKRNKRKSFSNSFTDIYRHLIRTSEINDKSFKSALLIANGQQYIPLSVFSSSSFEKIDEFEKKKKYLNSLSSVKLNFERLKLLNDTFISEESILGKLKNTFFKKFDKVERDLSEKTSESSELSIAIRTLQTKINTTLKEQRDKFVTDKANTNNTITNLISENKKIDKLLGEIEDYEPTNDNLLYQGLIAQSEYKQKELDELSAQITQLKRSQFSLQEIETSIDKFEKSIIKKENSIQEFDNLLYQNISNDPETIKKVYSYLSQDIAELDKSFIKKSIEKTDLLLTFFDGKIDVSDIEIEKELPTIKQLKEEVKTIEKELAEKILQQEAIKNWNGLIKNIIVLKSEIKSLLELIDKINKKPILIKSKEDNNLLITSLGEEIISIKKLILDKDEEINKSKLVLDIKTKEKDNYKKDISKYKSQYQQITEYSDIYEIEEIIDVEFDEIFEKFNRTYRKYSNTRDNRKSLKDKINEKLGKDIKDTKQFIREVDEEIINIPQMDKIISNLLDTLSHEIGSPTHSFITQFKDFRTFVHRSYNKKLAEYPVSNIH